MTFDPHAMHIPAHAGSFPLYTLPAKNHVTEPRRLGNDITMKTNVPVYARSSGQPVVLLAALLALAPAGLAADGADRAAGAPVLATAAGQDGPAVTRGQLKAVAREAFAVLEAGWPDEAGEVLAALIARGSNLLPAAADAGVVTNGEVKALAQPFFDRLILAGAAEVYPWTSGGEWADDEPATYAHLIAAFGLASADQRGTAVGTRAAIASAKPDESRSSSTASAPKVSPAAAEVVGKTSAAPSDSPAVGNEKKAGAETATRVVKVTIDYPAPGEKL